jgi:serine/threonine-protein kinase
MEPEREIGASLDPTTIGASGERTVRFEVGWPYAAGAPPSHEIAVLLRQRLFPIAVISLCATSYFNIVRLLRLEMTADIIRWTMVPGVLVTLFFAGFATSLRMTRRDLSLRQLRWLEGLLFGAIAAYFATETFTVLFKVPAYLAVYATRPVAELSILGRQFSILWLTLIVAYGTFIPNTGRRCAAVTGVMGLMPLIVIIGGWLITRLVPGRTVLFLLAEMVLWSLVGVAFAVYGSHKLAALRQEAEAARRLGKYRLTRRLGGGGMGEVYLAEHVLLRRPCAVKVIRPGQTGDPAILRRFLREVQVTATLTHPNTVQVFDYGQASDGTLFYAMEYLAGPSLELLVRDYGPLPPARTVHVLRQLCGALAEAHGAGLIHRDIKPANVILCRRGGVHDVAKLLDFGIVRLQAVDGAGAGATQAGLIFGTPAYMSPEQAGGRELDARSDIYGLGALAYFLATGHPPFDRENVVQVLSAHLSDPVAPIRSRRSDWPADLDGIVLRCLAKAPDERYSTVDDLDRVLAACTTGGRWMEGDAAAWWQSNQAAAV